MNENAERLLRARRVLVRAYVAITDFAAPPVVVAEIAEPIAALETWLAREEPHLKAFVRRAR